MKNHHPYIQANVHYIVNHHGKPKISSMFFYNKFIQNGGDKKYTYQCYDFWVRKIKGYNEYSIFIGDKKKCLISSISYDPETKEINNEIVMQSFGYYNNCSSSTKKLPRGIGTNGIMFSFIQYIRDRFQGKVKKIIISDNAYYICDKMVSISLSDLYFFKYGDFYYSYRFGYEIYDVNNSLQKKFIKKFENLRTTYIQHYQVTDHLLEFLRDSLFITINNTDQVNHLLNELIVSQNIPTFLQRYKFQKCALFQRFIDSLKNYFTRFFNVDFNILNHSQFVLYL